jgi:hypothetical protein
MSVAPDYACEEAPRIRVNAYRAPNPEPPYDEAPPARLRSAPALAPWPQPTGAAALRLVPEPDAEEDDDGVSFEPERTPRERLEDPRPRAAVLARALLEALAGDRPLGQLLRWMTPEVFASVEPLVAARGTRPWAMSVRRVFVTEPTPGIAEVTAVVQRGPRCGALALRLEGLDGRWIVTALQIG